MPSLPDRFEVPIHRSLTEPILLAGLPRSFAFVLWTLATVVVIGLYQLWYIPVHVGLHLLFVFLTKREPRFFEVAKRALGAQRRLDP